MRTTILTRMRIGTAAAAILLIAACEVAPDGVSKDDIEYFDDAVASIGCEMVNESDYSTVEFQAGLTREQVLGLTKNALDFGRAERMENGGVRFTNGRCEA